MCGHKSGVISAWAPDQTTILKLMGYSKFHDGAINRIYFKDTMVGSSIEQFVMTCSSDCTLKVFKSDAFENIASKTFDYGVLDIFQSYDYEKTEYFIVSLENGDLIGLNLGLDIVFKIPSILGSKYRSLVNISNPHKGEVEGNFLIVSDGNCINVNLWIKQGAIDSIIQSDSGSRGGSTYRGGHKGGYRGGSKGGNYDGGRGGYDGGYGDRKPFVKRGGY